MSFRDGEASRIEPARLEYLVIYNPALGPSEENETDQIIFHYSRARHAQRRKKGNQIRTDDEKRSKEDQNEALRQIGLAQGINGFAGSFASNAPVDTIDTEKHRLISAELEKGWWIVACIRHTRITRQPYSSSTDRKAVFEYSSREVTPSNILLQHLRSAHRSFLLHHGGSLAALFDRLGRHKFCRIVQNFWDPFSQAWDVLHNGNPAVEVFSGIKLAAVGELGVGVGEEEWGSAEREYLEGFMTSVDGLADVLVSRFGNECKDNTKRNEKIKDRGLSSSWLGSGKAPRVTDGLIFSGVGSLSRDSVATVSQWMTGLYRTGEFTYGVKSNPRSVRQVQNTKTKVHLEEDSAQEEYVSDNLTPGSDINPEAKPSIPASLKVQGGPPIPPPIVPMTADEAGGRKQSDKSSDREESTAQSHYYQSGSSQKGSDGWARYLTLGYGSPWGSGSANDSTATFKDGSANKAKPAIAQSKPNPDTQSSLGNPSSANSEDGPSKRVHAENGEFLIGLKGNIGSNYENEDEDEDEDQSDEELEWEDRLIQRSIFVRKRISQKEEVSRPATPDPSPSAASEETHYTLDDDMTELETDGFELKCLRVVVYTFRPFIVTLLFELNTSPLSLPSFYRELNYKLKPLCKSLVTKTSLETALKRHRSFGIPVPVPNGASLEMASPIIHWLTYDPITCNVHTSIQNISPPGGWGDEDSTQAFSPWTRLEALNVHTQIQTILGETTRRPFDRERTVKTNRGWWVTWLRLSHENPTGSKEMNDSGAPNLRKYKEAILVRRATDQSSAQSSYGGTSRRASAFGVGMGLGLGRLLGSGTSEGQEQSTSTSGSPSKLAEGIGVDTRRYVDSLFNLNR